MLISHRWAASIKPFLRMTGASVMLGSLVIAISPKPAAADFTAIIYSGAQVGPPSGNQVITVPTPVPVTPNVHHQPASYPPVNPYIPHHTNTVIRRRVNYSTIVNPYESPSQIYISRPGHRSQEAFYQGYPAQPVIIQRVRVIGPEDPHPVDVRPLGRSSHLSIFDTPGNVIRLD